MATFTTPPNQFDLRLRYNDVLNINGGSAFNLWIGDGAVTNMDNADSAILNGKVASGGVLNVHRGTVKYITIDSGGVATFYGTGVPNFRDEGVTALTTINGGQLNAIGGQAAYTTINSGELSIQGRGISHYTTINGGTESVFGTSNNAVINPGGRQQVAYTGVVNDLVLAGGTQELAGRAFRTTIETGTQTIIGAIGLADHTTMNGGLQVARQGGKADYTTINDGAQRIESGGTANHATVGEGGLQNIEAGGVANYSIVAFGGSQVVSGTANFTTIDQGESDVGAGGTTNHTTVRNRGKETVASGGTANDALVGESGTLVVAAGGTSNGTTVEAIGLELVSGTANNTTVKLLGVQRVTKGGTANGTLIEARGTQEVAGTANDTTIQTGGNQIVSGSGVAHNTTFGGADARLSVASPSSLTGTITNWRLGNVIELENVEIVHVIETTDDEIVVTYTTADRQTQQMTYMLVDDQADTHVTFEDDGEGGAKLVLEADASDQPLAALIEIGSASAGAIGGGAIGDVAAEGSGGGHLIIDVLAMRDELASLGDDIPDDWFAKVRGTDDDNWIRGGSGDDTIDGGGGENIVAYSQPAERYTITTIGDFIIVEDRSGHDGTDTLSNVQHLEFQGSRLDVTLLTAASTLSREQLGQLVELYVGYFDRAPDALGLAYWGSRMVEGMSLAEIARSFFSQPETIARYPAGTTTEVFISTVYQNVLGRVPDPAGLAYWVNEVDEGSLGRDLFVLAFINGARSSTDSATDAQHLANKTAVGLHFAIERGLSDLDWAKAVMQNVDATAESVSAAHQMTDDFAAQAATTDPRLLLPMVGSAESPVKSVKTGDWLDQATWESQAIPGVDVRNVDVAISSAHIVTLAGENLSTSNLTVDAGATLDLSDGALSVHRLVNRGDIEVHDAGDLQVFLRNSNVGTVEARDGGKITFWFSLDNSGSVIADGAGSVIALQRGLDTRNGTVQVRDGAEVSIRDGGQYNPGKVDLLGDNSTLELPNGGRFAVELHEGNQRVVLGESTKFQGQIGSFESGDTIHLLDVDFDSRLFHHDFAVQTLTIGTLGPDTSIKLVGVGPGAQFTFSSDGHGGVLIGLV